jgi:hypothetical protein
MYDLDPTKKILKTFLKELEEIERIRKNMSAPQSAQSFTIKDKMPIFEETEFSADKYWQKEDAYIWIYAEPWTYTALMHRPKPNRIPDYYYQAALPLYQQWRQENKELFHRNCKLIPSPLDKVSLIDYLNQLAITSSEENEHRDVWIESLRSFIQFLREDTKLDQKGPLECLFPSQESCKGMEFRKNHTLKRNGNYIKQVECRSILRRIEDTVFPVDIMVTAEILKNLSIALLEGRPNSQRSAAEALGFAWLCLAVGAYRLMTREDLVFSTEIDSFKNLNLGENKDWFNPTYFIGIQSLHGVIDVPVSKTHYEYLLALPREPGNKRIFNMDWETVLRTFRNKGVKPSSRASDLGPITFLTFMSQPHEAIGHRAFLAQKFSKGKKLSPTKQSE